MIPFTSDYDERRNANNRFLLQSMDREFCLGANVEVTAEDCENATAWQIQVYQDNKEGLTDEQKY